jgi:tRNA 2-selenouridine synthase
MAAPIQRTDDPFDGDYSEVIDVRSPAEFEQDHIPGAINLPSLSNEERAEVGTIYKQVNPFDARKIGAALVFANLSRHLTEHFATKEKDYRPLVYCWRGGQRSGSVATILSMIGWRATVVEGGYKAYRRIVMTGLESKPSEFTYRIVGGKTGSAKTDILHELERRGEQVLDLEGLASHRGSLLGSLPGRDQPSQRLFESLLFDKFRSFCAEKVVWIEAESSKIGRVYLPIDLMEKMVESRYYDLQPPLDWRVAYLAKGYAHLNETGSPLAVLLQKLIGRHSREKVDGWLKKFEEGDWPEVVKALLVDHYDPAYSSATKKKFQDRPIALDFSEMGSYSVIAAVNELLKREQSQRVNHG